MKMNSAKCKELIVEYCKNNKQLICQQFDPPLSDEAYEESLKLKNWKRESKEKSLLTRVIPGVWERRFDNRYFDNDLRGYVYTDANDKTVTALIVQGE